MTAQRQEKKGWRRGIALIGVLAGFCVAGHDLAARATTTERVVVNRFSGLAIEGFDPVAYFVDGQPARGLEQFEAAQAGVVWRFCNEGNRASFLAHPEVYGPRFGGYDPIEVARGVAYPGNPLFWVIVGERLYLFGREANRDAFAADSERLRRAADAHWGEVEQKLAQ